MAMAGRDSLRRASLRSPEVTRLILSSVELDCDGVGYLR